MADIDNLVIRITADGSGIQQVLKQSLDLVTGTVGEMNDQTVDWAGIFERAVSPAIISSVASLFGFAIEQSLQFQTAMNQTGTAAGLSTTQIGAMGTASQALADQTGQNATDIGTAFGAVAPVFADTATQQTFVADATQLAASGFGSLNDVVQAALPIMQMFGVTTSDQVNAVFTELMHGAEGSGESLSAFAGQFMDVAPDLKAGGANLSELNTILGGFSAEIANLGVPQASAAFATFGTAVSGANPALNAMLGSSKSLLDTVKTQGLPAALADMGNKILASGQSATLLYTNFGLSTTAIDGLESSATRLPAISIDAQKIATNAQSIADAFNQSSSALRTFSELWQGLKGDSIIAIGAVGNFFAAWQTGMQQLTTDISNKGFFGGIIDEVEAAGTIGDFATAAIQNDTNATGINTQLGKELQQQGINVSPTQVGLISDQASGNQQSLIDLLTALASKSSTSISGNTSLFSTFNLTVPKGSTGLTAKQIAQELYNQFNGISTNSQ